MISVEIGALLRMMNEQIVRRIADIPENADSLIV